MQNNKINNDYLKKYQKSYKIMMITSAVVVSIGIVYFNDNLWWAIVWISVFNLIFWWIVQYYARTQQQKFNFILQNPIPDVLWKNDIFKDSVINTTQKRLIANALKDFFILHTIFPNVSLSMPSIMVDKLWHAFILDTKQYQQYCEKAFGSYFHHIPNYQFTDKSREKQMFMWQESCKLQNINPEYPTQIPRLFLVDKLLLENMQIGDKNYQIYQKKMALHYRKWKYSKNDGSGGDGGSGSGNSKQSDKELDSGGDGCGSCGGCGS